jgi:hypothetical protein
MSALILISVLGVLVLYLGLFGKKSCSAILGWWARRALRHRFHITRSSAAWWSSALQHRFQHRHGAITAPIFLRLRLLCAPGAPRGGQYADIFRSWAALSSPPYTKRHALRALHPEHPLYILMAARRLRSNEASFKYFLLGSFSTAFLLMGITLLYGLTGSFHMDVLAEHMAKADNGDMVQNFGLFFVVVGLAFKVGAVPFHFWVPDVYHGAPLVTIFMSTVVKWRLRRVLPLHRHHWHAGCAGASWRAHHRHLLVGNAIALRQTNFKRLMAYSSVAHSFSRPDGPRSRDGHGAAVGHTLLYYTFISLATTASFPSSPSQSARTTARSTTASSKASSPQNRGWRCAHWRCSSHSRASRSPQASSRSTRSSCSPSARAG